VVHLIERNQRGAADAGIAVAEPGERALAVVDADEGIDQRVLQEAVAAGADRVEQRGHGGLLLQASQGGRRLASELRRFVLQQDQERGKRGAVELEARGVGGREPDGHVLIGDGVADGNAVAGQRPDCIPTHLAVFAPQCGRVGADVQRPVAHRKPGIAQQARGGLLPVDLQSARVVEFRRVHLADSIDAALDLRLVDARGRAADAEPSARVDHDQAAVRVLEHVGRVEVGVVADEELLIAPAERRAVTLDDVPLHLMGVELGAEPGAGELGTAGVQQAGRRHPADVDHRGQQVAAALELAHAPRGRGRRRLRSRGR